MPNEFRRDEFSRRRIVLENVEHHQSVFNSATCWNLMTQDSLLAVVMSERSKDKGTRGVTTFSAHDRHCGGAATPRLENGPAREAAGNFLHILLGVAAINPKRMQLHQFAGVVFIDAAPLLLLRSLILRIISHAHELR